MANYTYTQNGIIFKDVKEPVIAQGGITVGNKYSTNAFTGELNSISVDATNAVSIDWNGAQLGYNTTISTTGQLLSYIITLSERITLLEANGGGSSKPVPTLVGATERSNTAYYNNYNLVKVKVQTNSSYYWPVTVTNRTSDVALIDNTYFNYDGDVSNITTSTFTTIQLYDFDEYVTIVPSSSADASDALGICYLRFSVDENESYAATFTDLNYSFTEKA